jgi:hypothetical protein
MTVAMGPGAFNVAHEEVFGSNAETGLRLAIFVGLEQGHREFEKIYLIEYSPSRVRSCQQLVTGQCGCSASTSYQ